MFYLLLFCIGIMFGMAIYELLRAEVKEKEQFDNLQVDHLKRFRQAYELDDNNGRI